MNFKVSGRSDIVTDPPSTTFAPNATVAFLNNNNNNNNGHKLHQPSRKNTEIINNNSRKNKKPSSYNTQFSSTNYFIFSLAVSDLIYNFFLALVVITKNDIMNILDREYFCEISVCITYICSFLSAAFTTLFTFQVKTDRQTEKEAFSLIYPRLKISINVKRIF
jgi:hypothetical protein